MLQVPRTGFVGFPGSGNSWVRLLLDIATGLNTCGDRGARHQDGNTLLSCGIYYHLYCAGGCMVTLTHHSLKTFSNKSRSVYIFYSTISILSLSYYPFH